MKDANGLQGPARNATRNRWSAAASVEERYSQVPVHELPGAWRALPAEVVADLLFGFGKDVARFFDRCNSDPRWEERFQQEYDRGPSDQRSRTEIATQILELV